MSKIEVRDQESTQQRHIILQMIDKFKDVGKGGIQAVAYAQKGEKSKKLSKSRDTETAPM